MTLKYALTRFEILRFFLKSLTLSPRLLITVVALCLFPGIVRLSVQGLLMPSVTVGDLIGDCYWTLGAFPLFLLLVTVRGKTAERTLTVNEVGISTAIGALKGEVSWSKIKTVRDASDYVLIARISGNAFFVPNRAFNKPDQKAQFLSDIGRWRSEK